VCSFDTIGNRTRDLPASGTVPQPSAPTRSPSPSDTIGNRTRDLPASGTVPQPSAPTRSPSPSDTLGNRNRVLPGSGAVPQPSASPRAMQWQLSLSAAVNILELRCRWKQKLSDINQIICQTLKLEKKSSIPNLLNSRSAVLELLHADGQTWRLKQESFEQLPFATHQKLFR